MGDYSKIPQRLHKYPASDRAKEIVHKSFTLDTLFSGVWPEQWSSPGFVNQKVIHLIPKK